MRDYSIGIIPEDENVTLEKVADVVAAALKAAGIKCTMTYGEAKEVKMED